MKAIRPYVLLISDSLAFPRSEPEVVRYEDTYIAMLKAEFPDFDFIHVGRGGGTIRDLYNHANYFHAAIDPALVLMHCGIVDCAPRALTVIEQQIIARLPILGNLARGYIKCHAKRLRRWRKITYTSLSDFTDYINRFESHYNNVYWIGILPSSSEYEDSIGGISDNIRKYNEVLRQRNFITTDEFTVSDIMADFHHLNCSGHLKLFGKLVGLIQTLKIAKESI